LVVTYLPEVLEDPFSQDDASRRSSPSGDRALLGVPAGEKKNERRNISHSPPSLASTPLPPSCGLPPPGRRWRRCVFSADRNEGDLINQWCVFLLKRFCVITAHTAHVHHESGLKSTEVSTPFLPSDQRSDLTRQLCLIVPMLRLSPPPLQVFPGFGSWELCGGCCVAVLRQLIRSSGGS
jgi:hypothetical protein